MSVYNHEKWISHRWPHGSERHLFLGERYSIVCESAIVDGKIVACGTVHFREGKQITIAPRESVIAAKEALMKVAEVWVDAQELNLDCEKPIQEVIKKEK